MGPFQLLANIGFNCPSCLGTIPGPLHSCVWEPQLLIHLHHSPLMGNQANLYLVKIWYLKLNVSMKRRGLDCLPDQINHLGKYLGKCTLSGSLDAKSSFPKLYSTRDHHKEEEICPTELHIAFSDHPHLYMITYSLLETHAPFSKWDRSGMGTFTKASLQHCLSTWMKEQASSVTCSINWS